MKALNGCLHPITCLILLLLLCNNTSAQTDVDGNSLLKKMTPVIPEAGVLGRYEAIPVSLYTSVPEISIPLYEINMNELEILIALIYHACGSKVDDVSSCVGPGWTLSTGGAITRQQKGIADSCNDPAHRKYWLSEYQDRIKNPLYKNETVPQFINYKSQDFIN